MGRPPCCDKIGIKKGPWTPEEDIILVSYIQEHGPGNWRTVPNNTGLLRCSKSCRLRWTNYLRPGIKRGNFTEQEDKMIIHLQALLGNRWAAIASYLPQRTDNDIKNYWNTHLRKKLKKLEGSGENGQDGNSASSSQSISKGQWERRLQTDIHTAKQALCDALSIDKPTGQSGQPVNIPNPPVQPATYASSAENIARLLQNWTTKSQKPAQSRSNSEITVQSSVTNNPSLGPGSTSSPSEGTVLSTAFDQSIFTFNSNVDVPYSMDENNPEFFMVENKPSLILDAPTGIRVKPSFIVDAPTGIRVKPSSFVPQSVAPQNVNNPNTFGTEVPLAVLEKWLLDDANNVQAQDDLMGIGMGIDMF